MKYSWILFDADDTLFDFGAAAEASLRLTFQQSGYPFEDRYLAVYERINRQFWSDFEKGLVAPKDLRSKRFEMFLTAIEIVGNAIDFGWRYLKNISNDTTLIDGAEEVIEQLARDTRLMLITNGLQEVQRPRFAQTPIRPYFEDIVISDEVGSAKPEPKIFDVAFDLMGNPEKSKVLIVGDNLSSDIQGGINYGIDTCWFNPEGKANAHNVECRYEIKSLRELLTLGELG
ncbi:MAG: 2-haloacid dehalogenase [Candidatus Krumholzibacteriia bacterium]|jgi:2-haloacid dehalogenase